MNTLDQEYLRKLVGTLQKHVNEVSFIEFFSDFELLHVAGYYTKGQNNVNYTSSALFKDNQLR